MEGFFIKREDHKPRAKPGEKKKRATKSKSSAMYDCSTCGLDKSCITPKMPVHGKGKKRILVIAEAPGQHEDEKGIPLIGKAGQELRRILDKFEIDLDRDCWKTNACCCRPPSNRTPSNKEIRCCHARLDATIRELQPEKILLLGKTAVQSFMLDRESVTGLEKWVKWATPDQKYKAWVFATYHPSYLLRKENEGKNNGGSGVIEKLFTDHIFNMLEWDEVFPDYSDIKSRVKILQSDDEISNFLDEISQCDTLAFDYETTGLKPYAAGHRIVCMAFSAGLELTGAFMTPTDPALLRKVEKILRSPRIKKIAQNIKFEDTWTRQILGYEVRGWYFDTMLATHVLDNRPGITGLKFQGYVNFGIDNYSYEVERFLKAPSSNEFNQIDKCPVEALLLYNGMDPLVTYLLAQEQIPQIYGSHKLADAYGLLHDGVLELSRVESNGIRVDSKYYQMQSQHLQRKLDRLKSKVMQSEEAVLWRRKEGKELNINSNPQLSKLLYQYLGHSAARITARDNESTDQEALETIKTDFTRGILDYRKLYKVRNTYLEGFIIEDVDSIMHPNFNLNTVRTYRSSSSNPNFQNIPKRDEESQRIVRSGIIPRPGRQILEVDYSGIEVRISACYHHDKEMIRYINDPTTDMHRDMAMQLFRIDKPKDVSKRLRQAAKNGFVFPQFYGDYFVNCASNIWGQIDKEDKEYLKTKGIKSLTQFQEHVKKVEHDFWYKKFTGYTEWKDATWQEYQRKGYVDLLTGFRCSGYMQKNDVLNYPIQGTAFHCLLWSLIRVGRFMRESKMKSLMIGQIHDSMVIDVMPEELPLLKPYIGNLVRKELREYWNWIIVPMDIEADITEVDGNWFIKHKEEI